MNLQEELKKLDLVPFLGRIIVKQKEVEEGDVQKEGLIHIPEELQERRAQEKEPTEGTVLAVGADVTLTEPGDEVFYGKYSGSKVCRNDNIFHIMNEDDLLAKINGGKNGR